MTDNTTTPRIPLNTLAIAFGLAGLAEVWTFASAALSLPPLIGDTLWMLAAVGWAWLMVAHLRRGHTSSESLLQQLRNPVQGPIAALAPVVGMLLAAELFTVWPIVSRILVITFISLSAIFAGWLIAEWCGGGIPIDAIHGGYFLPTVAGGFIAANAAAATGLTSLAVGAFLAATFFWIVMFAIIVARLMFRPPLPTPLVPTLAIFLAPPAVAGIAWFRITGEAGTIEYGLAAITAVMALIQLALIPRYLALPFSVGFWSFTFPVAAAGSLGILWLTRLHPDDWEALVTAIAAGVTALIVGIAAQSITSVRRDSRRQVAPATVVDADHEPGSPIATPSTHNKKIEVT
ncbi:transporter [Salinibacterium sp.]|uniref:SLAC1 family transporter n=1 Tax=Salinibacterium sp. TaxID=1915057 RepID=UPI00286B1A36|nr:transporter [Salinibacterium sp.]